MPARDPSSFWTVVFAALLHAGLICIAWPSSETHDAIIEIAGGEGGEGGGGGMGFINPGDGHAPAPSDAPARVPTAALAADPMAGPSLDQVIAHCQLDVRDLATQVEQIPASLSALPPEPGSATVALAVIGPAIESEPAIPVNPHRGEVERALAQRGNEGDRRAASEANAPASPGIAASAIGATSSSSAFAGSAAPNGTGTGGPVGRPGAPGSPGIGGGGASGLRPTYPGESLRRGEAGTVVLAIEILPTGSHGKIELLTSSGYPRLDRAALQSASEATYRPALADGRPIRSIKQVAVTFRLDEAGR